MTAHGEHRSDQTLTYRALLGAIALGVVLRVVVLFVSYGSNDMATWTEFADGIRADGIWSLYRDDLRFNHPPLMGFMAAALRSVGLWTGIPFRILFKLPCLIGDGLIMFVLWRCWRESGHVVAAAALAVFSCNPVSILVTAHHGNTDTLVGAFGLFAAYAMSRRRFMSAGLLVALAANVKIVGLLWAPGLFLLCRDWRTMSRFALGMGVGLLPFVLPMVAVPSEFHRNVLSYGSKPRGWGIYRLIMEAEGHLGGLSVGIRRWFAAWGRYLALGGVFFWAVFGRVVRMDPFRAGAVALAAFLTLTPGFAVQYLVWIVPVLAATSLRYSFIYAVLGGAVAVLDYHAWLTDDWPLRTHHLGVALAASNVGLLLWVVLIAFQWTTFRGALEDR